MLIQKPKSRIQGPPDVFLAEVTACLTRVREHVYGQHVGGLIVEAARGLLEAGPEPRRDGRQTFWPVVVRPEGDE